MIERMKSSIVNFQEIFILETIYIFDIFIVFQNVSLNNHLSFSEISCKILILDEATAAMDTETERNIQNSLTKLKAGRTTLAIAHRLSTLRDSDYLAVIDEGKIIEYGTYQELLKQKGEFYKQYKIQAEALKTIGIGTGETEEEEE